MRHPYCLLAGAKHYQLNSIFGNSARHQKRQGEPVVLVHPDDAARHNLVDGMVIKVFNDRGEFHAQVSVSDEVRRGVISTTKGSWPGDRSGNRWVNATVAERASDMGNGTVFNDNRVSIECAPEL